MITLVTGRPGGGKSYYCVRRIFQAIERGKIVVTNIELLPGWQDALVQRAWGTRLLRDDQARTELRKHYDERLHTSSDLTEITRCRLPGCGTCVGCTGGTRCRQEGRGLVVLDEAHDWLNSRTWDGEGTSERNTARSERLDLVGWFSHHRKLGFDIDLVTQDEKRIDNQVRGNFEYHTRLKNTAAWKPFGLRVIPFNLFAAVTSWHATAGERVNARLYTLSKLANYYDTMASPALSARDVGDLIWLPLPEHERAARRGAPAETAARAQREPSEPGALTAAPRSAAER